MLAVVSKRTYGQYCGLAEALDVVGQRWALLIVRDLVPGPRRFTDLFQGLPGVSTDLLTDRLRSLEAAGAIRRREIRTPVPASLYELTDRGRELAQIAGSLARWGAPLLPGLDEPGERSVNGRWLLQYCSGRYRGGLPDGDVHILLDDNEELTLSLTAEAGQLHYGHSDREPLLTLTLPTAALPALLRNPPADADHLPPEVNVEGQAELFGPLLRALQARD